jgi:hypothetical protein
MPFFSTSKPWDLTDVICATGAIADANWIKEIEDEKVIMAIIIAAAIINSRMTFLVLRGGTKN